MAPGSPVQSTPKRTLSDDEGSVFHKSTNLRRSPVNAAKRILISDLNSKSEKVGDMEVEVLLSKISAIIDLKLENLALKKQMDCISKRVDDLEKENVQLKLERDSRVKRESEVFRRMVTLEVTQREKNLMLYGLEAAELNISGIAVFLEKALGVSTAGSISAIRLIGKGALVEFHSGMMARDILRNAYKLKGTKVSVRRDLPREVRQRSGALSKIRDQLKGLPNVTLKLFNGELMVNEEWFQWDLQSEKLMHEEMDGLEYLKKMGLEIKTTEA
jgi:hypothetical protein